MPNDTISPAQLAWTASPLTIKYSDKPKAARLYWFGGDLTSSFSGTILSATVPQLDRLTSFEQLLDPDGTPSHRFQAIWQESMEKIEEAFEALTTQVTDNSIIISRLVAAEALANAANDNATDIGSVLALADSYVNPAGVLSASDTGTITIAAHERIYGDTAQTTVDVDGGSVTGLNNDTAYSVFYFDAGRTGGAVEYQATTSNVAQTGITHVVGRITIPPAGGADTSGTSPTAPGTTDPGTGTYDKFGEGAL